MTDTGASPVKDKNIQNLSSSLSAQLGISADEIETALSSVMEQNNFKIFQSKQNKRKDSLSSVIEITHDGATSINVKLPSLYIEPPTVQEENSKSKSIAGKTSKPSDVHIANSIFENLSWPDYSCPKDSSNNKSDLLPEYQNRQTHMELKSDQRQNKSHKQFQDVDESFSTASQSYIFQDINKHPNTERLIDISPSSSPNHYVIDNNERKQESNEELEPPSTSLMGNSWSNLGINKSQEELGGWEDIGTSYEPIQSFTDKTNAQNVSEPTSAIKSNHSFVDGWDAPNVYEKPESWNEVSTDIQPSYVNNINNYEYIDDSQNVTINHINESENKIEKNPDIIDYKVRESVSSPVSIKAIPEVAPQKVQNTNKTKSSEKYSSEWPSLSESAKKSDSKKNTEVDLGAWGPMSTNLASAWGKPKKWKSETETKKPETPATPVWNPLDIYTRVWTPIQDPKPFFQKRRNTPFKHDFDDNEGWGAPPAKCIPWNDSRQGYCVDLIEEQKETTFWSMQNGTWVNVSEESRITQEKKTVEYTSDGSSRREVRQTRTQTQRIERQGIEGSDNVSRNENIEHSREREERGLIEQEDMIINISDPSDNENGIDSKETDFNQSKSTRTTKVVSVPAECPLERLGNPKWKFEREWRQPKQTEECDDLINLDPPSLSDSKSSENDDEQESGIVPANSYGGSYNFDNYSSANRVSSDRLIERTTDVMTEHNQFIKAPKNNSLLINLLESTIGCVDSNSNYPHNIHGAINNEMSNLNVNDLLSDSTCPPVVSTNLDVMNNPDFNLLSFDDDDKPPTSSNGMIPIEKPSQENEKETNKKRNSINFDELDMFLANLERGNNTEVARSEIRTFEISEIAQPEVRNFETFEDSNGLPAHTSTINQTVDDSSPLNSRTGTLDSRPKYRCENLSLANMESAITNMSAPDVNNKNNEDKVNGPQAVLDSDPNYTKPETNGSEFLIHITIETQSYGRQILHLRIDDDPIAAATEFCKKWEMMEYEEALKGFVLKEQKKKIRKLKSKRRR
ncbi:11479_t:CDS:2 [Funneliformis mosseae]|uniref:11479_t:CDS:1 n=1 Tax=Funneliformis mosseae TaxID=27381 RepID=A0A9N9EGD5_FUNMO|nr:11479_t:CDS:2 [Funneliformis mosseae]